MIIEHLHIEASSYCNARCPGCPRNGYGYPLEGFFKEKNLGVEQLHQLLNTYKMLERFSIVVITVIP